MNKTMQRVFIITIAAVCCLTGVVLTASRAFGSILEDGYAVPSNVGIQQSLAKTTISDPVSLLQVKYEDVIYKKVNGYFVGDAKEPIDIVYPIYTDDGVGIRFLNEENWLITSDVDLYQTFDGMYLSEGISYNSDKTQADGDEFILLALPNGLHMNAQHAVLNTRTEHIVIPCNSIINFTETMMSWFAQNNGTLSYHRETALFDATITIGEHTYKYIDLLDALGLVHDAIELGKKDDNRPDDETLQKAQELLNPTNAQNTVNGTVDRTSTTDRTETNEDRTAKDGLPRTDDNRTQSNNPADGESVKDEKPQENADSSAKGDNETGKNDAENANDKKDKTVSFIPQATKVLEGTEERIADGRFRFVLENVSGTSAATVETTGNVGGAVEFKPLVFSNPGKYTYQIREIENKADNKVVYDTSVFRLEITVSEEGSGQDAKLVTSVKYFRNGIACEANELVFTNRSVNPDVPQQDPNETAAFFTINAAKRIDGGSSIPEDGRFQFILKQKTETGEKPIQYATNKGAEITFETLSFEKPGTYTYYVQEVMDDRDPTYQYDSSVYTVNLTVTETKGEEDSTVLTVTPSYLKDNREWKNDLEFVNRINPNPNPQPDAGSVEVTFKAQKWVDNDPQKAPEDRFRFVLEERINGIMQPKQRTSNKKDGAISFAPVVLTKAGTYVYQMREIANDLDSEYLYDSGVITALVTVSKNAESNKLTAQTEYFKNGISVPETDLRFMNRSVERRGTDSDSSGMKNVELFFSATKTLDGKEPASGLFRFVLTSDEEIGNVPRQIVSNEGGKVEFNSVVIREPGIYNYFIREVIDNSGAYVCDETEYRIQVNARTVMYASGETELKTEVSYFKGSAPCTAEDLIFANRTASDVKPDTGKSVSVALTARKQIDDGSTYPETGRFSYLLSTEVEGKSRPVQNVRNNGALITFDNLAFTKPGEYYYTIQEVLDEDDTEYVYDSTVYSALIKVEENANTGSLTAQTSFFKSGVSCGENELLFINRKRDTSEREDIVRTMPADQIVFSAVKYLDDVETPVPEGQFRFVLEKLEDGQVKPQQYKTNKNTTADGKTVSTVTFNPISHTVPGVYTYQIREVETANNTAYRIDETVYTVLVKVKDEAGQLHADVSYRKNGVPCEPKSVTFTNHSNSEIVAPGELNVSARKYLHDYRKAENDLMLPTNGRFHFVLEQEMGDGSVHTCQYQTNVGGLVEFASERITEAGEYVYRLYELPEDGENINGSKPAQFTYDNTVYTLHVSARERTVSDGTKEILLSTVYYKNGVRCDASDVQFHNKTTESFEEEPTARVFLNARKEVIGVEETEIESGLFQFELNKINADNSVLPVQTVANVGTEVTFDVLEFREPGTYTYRITEIANNNNQLYLYDSAVYTANITVVKNNNGALEASVNVLKNGSSSGDIVFTNRLNPDYQETLGGLTSVAEYTLPEVVLENIKSWSYALGTDLIVKDPSNAIQRGIKISVFSDIANKDNGETNMDGLTVYPAKNNEGKSVVLRKTKYDTETFALSPMQPGSTVYLQLSYKYGDEPTEKMDGDTVMLDPESGLLVQVGGTPYLDEFGKPVVGEDGTTPVMDPATMKYVPDPAGRALVDSSGASIFDASKLVFVQNPDGTYKLENDRYVLDLEKSDFQMLSVSADNLSALTDQLPLSTADPTVGPNLRGVKIRVEVDTDTQIPLMVQKKKTYYSDFIEVKIPTVEEGNVQTVRGEWETVLGYKPNSIQLAGIKLSNTSEYDPDAGSNDFENFKLNTLPYVSKIELQLTPEGGSDKPIIITVPGSVVSKAMDGDGAIFTSSNPPLDSNTKYTYKANILDRYGNQVPFIIGPEGSTVSAEEFVGITYTNKQVPSVEISEVENVMDLLTLKVKVSDPDGAIVPGQPLRLTMTPRNSSIRSELGGTMNGKPLTLDPNDNTVLLLNDPKDGDEYEIKLDSLAFARLFVAEVLGDYSPVSDAAKQDGYDLEPERDVQFGRVQVYTAPLSNSNVDFDSRITDLMDTSVTLNLMMQNTTDLEILDIVDEYRFAVKDPAGNVVKQVILRGDPEDGRTIPADTIMLADLKNPEAYTYDAEKKVFVLHPGNDLIPRIELYGDITRVRGDNAWDSFNVSTIGSGEDESFTTPMQLHVSLPKGTLNNNTRYTVSAKAVVIKSGEEFDSIRVNLTNNAFTTKKIIPEILWRDLLVAADFAEFQELRIYDPDHTIRDGKVKAYLYLGNTLLAVDDIIATDDPTAMNADYAKGMRMRFDNLIDGAEYEIRFVALTYNDEEGFAAQVDNHVLKTLDVVGGSLLSGKVSLLELQNNNAKIHVTVSDVGGYLGRPGETGKVKLTVLHSESMEIPEYEEYKVIELELTKNEDGSLSLDEDILLEGLPADDGWKCVLNAEYHGELVPLSEMAFRTDSGYVLVSTHAQLIAAQRANLNANILVTSDFVQDQNTYVSNFNGTIDFQGHVVTKGSNITTHFLDPNGVNSKIMNLVYDYPAEGYYVNRGSVFNQISGQVENLIVRTKGSVEVTATTAALVSYYINDNGVLRNFILQLNGDVNLVNETSGEVGFVVSTIKGVVENGYVYCKNGGLVATGIGNGAAFGYTRQYSQIRNIFIKMDSWYRDGTPNVMLRGFHHSEGDFRNIYIFGDQYDIGRGESKGYLRPLSTLKITDKAASGFSNLWAITERSYTSVNDTVTEMGKTVKLYDSQWQSEMLGSAFDVEGCVPLGFFPRLNLPNSMQKYQEYLPLPILGEDQGIKLIDDGWATQAGYDFHDLDKGYITLRFKNGVPNSEIVGVDIENLVTQVVDTRVTSDDMYEVTLNVQVDSQNPAYVSSYKVGEIRYRVGTATRTTLGNYNTRNIEFWKGIGTPDQWADMNDNMQWNYKLTADLDLSMLSEYRLRIDGSKTAKGTTAFTGKLDGQEYVVSNIRLDTNGNGTLMPYVFYSVGSNVKPGVIQNLFAENVVIHANANSENYSGFIRLTTNAGSLLENVRIRNGEVIGKGYIGGLVGSGAAHSIIGCSVEEMRIGEVKSPSSIIIGGFAGSLSGKTSNCYTRDVAVVAVNSNVIESVGGFVGNLTGGGGLYEDCYSHGTILANASNVGGFCGISPVGDGRTVRRCIAYVNIDQRGGNYCGGFGGKGSFSSGHLVVLGDVAGAGIDTHRVMGQGGTNAYVYADQIVTGVEEGVLDGASKLLNGEQLSRRDTWQDIIRLGTTWNYAPVKDSQSLPKLVYDAARGDWQQKDIPLPGMSGDPILRVTSAIYNESYAYPFVLEAKLEHPRFTSEQIQELYAANDLKIELVGMDISQTAQDSENAQVVLGPISGEEATAILIQVKKNGLLMALDTYELKVSYSDPVEGGSGRKRDLSVRAQFMENGEPKIVYWEIPDRQTWIEKMTERGQDSENFLITGDVDFTIGYPDSLRELHINRLEGRTGANGEIQYGISNLAYSGGVNGLPLIEKISTNIGNLYFHNVIADFSGTESPVRGNTGVLLSVAAASNLEFRDLMLKCNRYSRQKFGFMADVDGELKDITMNTVFVQETESTAGSVLSYVGPLAAVTRGPVENVTVTNLEMDCPKSSYVGGVYGAKNGGNGDCKNITVEGLRIVGYSYVGGVAGTSTYMPINTTVLGTGDKHSIIASNGGAAGITAAGYHSGTSTNGAATVRRMTVKGSTFASGMYPTWHVSVRNVVLDNCTVEGTTMVGGIHCGDTSSRNTSATFENVEITDCTIRNTAVTTGSNRATGALIGALNCTGKMTVNKVSVRNTTVSGPCNVGAIGGYLRHDDPVTCTMSRVYVAEDVTVTSTGDNVGGIAGWSNRFTMTDSACGATVHAEGSNAGGILGKLELVDNKICVNMSKSYYVGFVRADRDCAAGLVGCLDSSSVGFTDTNMINCLVSGDIRSGGRISAWALNTTSSGEAGKAHVYICEDTTLNGNAVKYIKEYADSKGISTNAVPNLPDGTKVLLNADEFKTTALYGSKRMGFTAKYWNYSGLSNNFMPYTTKVDTANGEMLEATTNGHNGIPVPVKGAVAKETVVYASGINTINVESTIAGETVTVNGNSVTMNENGVVTLYYDFGSDVTVGSKTYSASSLNRKLMTWGDYWYYVDKEGNVQYGKAVITGYNDTGAEELQKIGKIAGISDVVHLWNGFALTRSGSVYKLNGKEGSAVLQSVQSGGNLTAKTTAEPYYRNEEGGQVFYYFTFFRNNPMQFRNYVLGTRNYPVSYEQNVLYDGVYLVNNTVAGEDHIYFSVLDKASGSVVSYTNPLNLGEAENEGIDYISNSMGYNGLVLLLHYTDGTMKGVRVDTGDIVFTYPEAQVSLFSYAMRSLRTMFSPARTMSLMDTSFMDSQAQQDDLNDQLEDIRFNDPVAGGQKTMASTNSHGGILHAGGLSGIPEGEGAGNGEHSIIGGGNLEGGGTAFEGGGTAVPTEQKDAVTGQDAEKNPEKKDEVQEKQPGAAQKTEGENPAEQEKRDEKPEDVKNPAELSGEAGKLSGEVGVLSGELGELSGTTGDTEDAENASGGAAEDDGSGSGDGMTDGGFEGVYGPTMIMYVPRTGRYEVVTTSSAVKGNPRSVQDIIEEHEQKKEEKTEEEEQESGSGFSINGIFNRGSYAPEKQGAILVSGVGVTAIGILCVIFFIIRKRKQ